MSAKLLMSSSLQMQDYNSFLEFVKFSIGSISEVPPSCQTMDWEAFELFCRRQRIVGLVFDGMDRSGLDFDSDAIMTWFGLVENLKSTNKKIDILTLQACQFWENKGYKCCILKGQANAMMYPHPELRTPGDIDIWVDGEPTELIQFAQAEAPSGHYSMHHVTMPVFRDVSVEVHYRPVFLDNWWKNKLLQRYIDHVKDKQFRNHISLTGEQCQINTPTDDFNAVFLLLHMWHHLLSTRNNLKQLIDYYYLLKRGFTSAQRNEIVARFKELGVLKYARGIMWIEHIALGLEEKFLLLEPDEQIGRLLLEETMHYGIKRKHRNKLSLLISRFTTNLNMFRHFPSPVLIAPLYLVWHQWWKWETKRHL